MQDAKLGDYYDANVSLAHIARDYEQQLDELRKQNSMLHSANTDLRKQLRRPPPSENNRNAESLKHQLNQLHSEKGALESRFQGLQQQLRQRQRENCSKKAENMQLQEAVSALTGQVASLQKEVDGLGNELGERTAELTSNLKVGKTSQTWKVRTLNPKCPKPQTPERLNPKPGRRGH